MMLTELQTPLFRAHQKLGGKLVTFAGYSMPVQYKSVLAESKAVRERAGMFDVSHMARLRLRGARVLEFLEWVCTNDVAKLADGQGQYSLLTNERGGCVDDIILYRISATEYRVVVNAANHEKDWKHLNAQNKFDVSLEDETEQTAMIAVQGPLAVSILSNLSDNAAAFQEAPTFGVVEAKIAGYPCFAARSGYTGEDGYELICSSSDGEAIWESLLKAGVEPCGLGARDVLRVEAGLPLYGHELSDELSPIAAGLGWAISKSKEFLGSNFINQARSEGTPKKLQGVRLESKRLPMPGMKVFVENREVGELSSGVYSALLDCGIGFAFIESEIALETPCFLDMRGKLEPAEVVSKRFYKRVKV